MAEEDPRLIEARNYIGKVIRLLEDARSKYLDHSDGNTIRAALGSLAVVQRCIGGGSVSNAAQISVRLRQVAAGVKSCSGPVAPIASTDLETAAGMFQAMAGG